MDLFSQPLPLPSTYYNTTNERGERLKENRRKAAAQNERVMEVMRSMGEAGPSQVWIAMQRSCPITSVRRALTVLTDGGLLEKTGRKRVGEYGREEYIWMVKG